MTNNQIVDFKKYVLEKDPDFYAIMDNVCVFALAKNGVDYYHLLENAFGRIRPTPSDLKKYSSLLGQFRKENRIYQPVPTIADDFWTYLIDHHERLTYKLDGDIDVVLENDEHKPIILPNAKKLSETEKAEFFTAWAEFSKTLMKVDSSEV